MPRNAHYSPVGPRSERKHSDASLKSETGLKREICDALTKLGIEWWRMQSGKVSVRRGWMYFAKKGTFDILASVRIVRGTLNSGPHFLWIETKRPGEDYRPEQMEFEVERAARYHMAWRVESVDELLEKIRAAGVIG